MYDIKQIAEECGIHWKTVEKIINQLEQRHPKFDWQEAFDWFTECQEIRDYADREAELRRRIGYIATTDAEEAIQMTDWEQQREEDLMQTTDGVREMLHRIYRDPSTTPKEKEKYKEFLLNSGPAGIATVIALYDGEEKPLARRWLGEEVISFESKEIHDILKDKKTVKVLSSRGWVKSVNDIWLKKPIKSVDFIKLIDDCKLIPGAGETTEEGRISLYTCKTDETVQEIPEPPKLTPMQVKKKPTVKPTPILKPVDRPTEADIEDLVSDDTKYAVEGKPLDTTEFCYSCGRIVKTDAYTGIRKDTNVYFCSEFCSTNHTKDTIKPKYGIGQTVSKDTVVRKAGRIGYFDIH